MHVHDRLEAARVRRFPHPLGVAVHGGFRRGGGEAPGEVAELRGVEVVGRRERH